MKLRWNIYIPILIIVLLVISIVPLLSEDVLSQSSKKKDDKKEIFDTDCLCPKEARDKGTISNDQCADKFKENERKSKKWNCKKCEEDYYCVVRLNPLDPKKQVKDPPPPQYQQFACEWRTQRKCKCPDPPPGWRIVSNQCDTDYYCGDKQCQHQEYSGTPAKAVGDKVNKDCIDA